VLPVPLFREGPRATRRGVCGQVFFSRGVLLVAVVPCVRLPPPEAGERISLSLPSGAVLSCVVRSYRETAGVLALACDGRVAALSGDRAVLRRVRDGQVYLFPEQVVEVSPVLVVTCSRPDVTREPRVQVSAPLVYALSGGVPQTTCTVDLSSGGLCFHAWPPPPAEGATLDLELALHPVGLVRARAAVVRVYGRRVGWPETGARFLEMCPRSARTLAFWLKAASPGI